MPTRMSWRLVLLALLAATARASHPDSLGTRFVDAAGSNAGDCLEHELACASIGYALSRAQPGNTIKVAAGIYDIGDLNPEDFLFGVRRAAGGYSEAEHYEVQDPERNRTILLGIEPRYRAAMQKQGFTWAANRGDAERGLFDDSVLVPLQSKGAAPLSCINGFAGQFPCRDVEFRAQVALADFSSRPTSAANVWGFVDLNDNREYAVIGLRNGTAIVDVTDSANPREVATIPGNSSAWRELKIYQHRDTVANRYRAYAYVTTEAAGSGLQVIDLSALPNTATLATTLIDTGSQHTAYVSNIDYATNTALPGRQAFLYLAGSNVGGGAWRAYSLANPASPQLVGAAPAGTGYMHDSASLVISDARAAQCGAGHNPCEVLIDFNETTVDLWDVTDKAAPLRLSSTSYPAAEYTHSGWPSIDGRFIFIHDELEESRRGLNTQIYTMNIDNLRAPTVVTSFLGLDTTIDHNGYAKGSKYYVAHYRRGLVIFDAGNPQQLTEVAHFDHFINPAANVAGFDGAWGVYPFLPSGTILMSDISNGLFLLKEQAPVPPPAAGVLAALAGTVSVAENGGAATIRVQRTLGTAGVVTLDYTTANGSALAGTDFTTTTGTLRWEAGETGEKSVTVPISNNATVTGNRSFQVNFGTITGGALLQGAASVTVTIQEDDVAAPPPAAGGGGGGALSLWLLALLGFLAGWPRRQNCLRKVSP